MYDNNELNSQRITKGKKAFDIDNDGPTNKKAQKNKWKKQKKYLRQQAEIQDYQQSKPTPIKVPLTKQEKQQNMVNDLKSYTSCPQSLIRKKLIQANYNKELALHLIYEMEESSADMMDVFDKNQDKKPTTNDNKNSSKQNQNKKVEQQKYPTNNKVEEQAYKLINEMYDKSEIQISGFQFEQLFNEITQIIKEDQKEKGRGVIEINNFVQTCMTAKDAILVGLKDVFKVQAEIQFDENDPVHVQLQNFIYQDTQRQVQQQVINKEEFPTLGESSKKKNANNNHNKSYTKNEPIKSSIVNQLQNEHRHTNGPIRKQDLFRPENYRPVVFTQKNSIFNVDNQQQSEDALRDLHKEYNHVSIQTLKIVYLTLEKNFHQSRTFLERYYPKNTAIKKVSVETNSTNSPKRIISKQPARRHLLSGFRAERIEQIDQYLQGWSLNQLRSEIEHLYNLRQVFHMTSKNITNSKQRQQLMRIANDRAPPSLISKLSKASRVKLIEQTMRINPNYVDLHGYREEQVSPILQGMIASIRENFDRGNERVKYRTAGGRTEATLQIMTGKGRHSHYGKSILKPCVKHWCEMHGLRVNVNQDNVEIFVPLV